VEVDAFAVADAGVLAFGFASYGADVFDFCEIDAAIGVFDLLVRGYLKEMLGEEYKLDTSLVLDSCFIVVPGSFSRGFGIF